MTLIAFHHAGGSPAAFTTWRRRFSPNIRIVSASLPGREKLNSYGSNDVGSILNDLAEQLRGETSAPYAIYGHSMGGTIGFAFAMHQAAHGRTAPRALMVGACVAPTSVLPVPPSEIGGAAGGAERHVGTGVAAIKRRQLAEDLLLLDRVRAYCTTNFDQPAQFPIRVFTGSDDPLSANPESWATVCARGVQVERIDGGHFFHRNPEFIGRVDQHCSDLLVA
ncbi:thioesterase II family protein [Rhodococcus sovatensis]|uniref:Thioesterase TesA n=1 Tax=Rhodococcus sovatensis TaxID=1805840 RepID=A0ABZ2PN93_9NOCA